MNSIKIRDANRHGAIAPGAVSNRSAALPRRFIDIRQPANLPRLARGDRPAVEQHDRDCRAWPARADRRVTMPTRLSGSAAEITLQASRPPARRDASAAARPRPASANCSPATPPTNRPPRISPRISSRRYTGSKFAPRRRDRLARQQIAKHHAVAIAATATPSARLVLRRLPAARTAETSTSGRRANRLAAGHACIATCARRPIAWSRLGNQSRESPRNRRTSPAPVPPVRAAHLPIATATAASPPASRRRTVRRATCSAS